MANPRFVWIFIIGLMTVMYRYANSTESSFVWQPQWESLRTHFAKKPISSQQTLRPSSDEDSVRYQRQIKFKSTYQELPEAIRNSQNSLPNDVEDGGFSVISDVKDPPDSVALSVLPGMGTYFPPETNFTLLPNFTFSKLQSSEGTVFVDILKTKTLQNNSDKINGIPKRNFEIQLPNFNPTKPNQDRNLSNNKSEGNTEANEIILRAQDKRGRSSDKHFESLKLNASFLLQINNRLLTPPNKVTSQQSFAHTPDKQITIKSANHVASIGNKQNYSEPFNNKILKSNSNIDPNNISETFYTNSPPIQNTQFPNLLEMNAKKLQIFKFDSNKTKHEERNFSMKNTELLSQRLNTLASFKESNELKSVVSLNGTGVPPFLNNSVSSKLHRENTASSDSVVNHLTGKTSNGSGKTVEHFYVEKDAFSIPKTLTVPDNEFQAGVSGIETFINESSDFPKNRETENQHQRYRLLNKIQSKLQLVRGQDVNHNGKTRIELKRKENRVKDPERRKTKMILPKTKKMNKSNEIKLKRLRTAPAHGLLKTSFRCLDKQMEGYFADVETKCQAFHICWEGRSATFTCPEGTLFSQRFLVCDWWYKVDCGMTFLYENLQDNIWSKSSS